MKDTLMIVNQMQADGVIGRYAIGGAIGATFYLDPTSTFDIGIFISFRDVPSGSLVSLGPIYDYLGRRGYKAEREYIIVEGWQVQFLPADDALYAEALSEAVEVPFDGITTWVMRAEHLMAIALRTGRGKDFIRLDQFLSSGVYNGDRLNQILARHGLLKKFEEFRGKYPGENA